MSKANAMLDEILNDPAHKPYTATFPKGEILFREGDEAQDLFVLMSGELEVIKGNIKITEIREPGGFFGELSFLLGSKRTATIKASTDVKVMMIPKNDVSTFLQRYPKAIEKITHTLADRLDETSQIVFGLKEFCDQLPDAVILADRDGKILTWNAAAENLYGRDWNRLNHQSVEEIYEEPHVYKEFLGEVESRYSARERILKIRHPKRGIRYISTSTTLLYDGHHNCQGVLSLGRDVTAMVTLEKRYSRTRLWILLSCLLFVILAASVYFTYPYLSKGVRAMDDSRTQLMTQIARDFRLLQSLLKEPFFMVNREKTTQVLMNFFEIQGKGDLPYKGLVLLDKEKKVFDAYAPTGSATASTMVGSSYAGIAFEGKEGSSHTVLVLYRPDKGHPMGRKGIELAFTMRMEGDMLGWIVFQMDMDFLKKRLDIDEEALKQFRFEQI
jgi:PAS domain S-box-containing protein